MTDPAGPPAPAVSELAATLVRLLSGRAQTLATAESLTGGLAGAAITGVAGASLVYRGGLITYATELKAVLAGVSPQVLAAEGPVAARTASQMAAGAARVCGADWGVATTGVAGPDSQDGHPAGQVFVAVAGPTPAGPPDQERDVRVLELSLSGDRAAIREQTVAAALELLLEALG